MRRIELLQGVEKIINALQSSNIRDALRNSINEKSDSSVLFEALQKFSNYTQTFNDVEMKIIDILSLSALNDTKVWMRLVSS